MSIPERSEMSEFVYLATHDLREPLRNISNFSQLLMDQCGREIGPTAGEYVAIIDTAARRALQVVNDLVEYSTLEEPHAKKMISLSQLVGEIRAELHKDTESFTCDDLPEVRGNLEHLACLFRHLFANAIKFQGSDPLKVHTGVKADGDFWLFTVTDNGIGFEMRHAEQIFGVFKRLHAQDDFPGTGIGLAICRRVVTQHGGRIWAAAELGTGATISFTLPRA